MPSRISHYEIIMLFFRKITCSECGEPSYYGMMFSGAGMVCFKCLKVAVRAIKKIDRDHRNSGIYPVGDESTGCEVNNFDKERPKKGG